VSLIQASIWTATPPELGGDAFTPVNWFNLTDPFAIVMGIQIDQSVIDNGWPLNATFQVVNPRQDPYNHAWYTITDGNIVAMPTIDNDWDFIPQEITPPLGTNFAAWLWWNQYAEFSAEVNGEDSTEGIFYAQGQVSVQATNSFATPGPFWFRVVDLGVITE
jgi:hypothetical protein